MTGSGFWGSDPASAYLETFSGDTHREALKTLQGAMNVCFGKAVLGTVYPLAVDCIFGPHTHTAGHFKIASVIAITLGSHELENLHQVAANPFCGFLD